MATVDDFATHAPSAEPAANPNGSGPFSTRRTSTTRDDFLSWIVRFDELDGFYQVCYDLEETIVISEDPPASITRVVPLRHPFSPQLYALDAQGRALTASDVYDAENPYDDWYEYLVVTVHFGVLPFSFTDRPYVSVRGSGKSSVVTLPTGTLKFAGNDEPLDLAPGIPVYQEDLIVTHHEVTDLSAKLAVLRPLAGMVNSAAIAINGVSHAIGTLHFPELDWEEAISIGGSRKAQVSFPVRYRPRPTWLQAFRKDGTVDDIDPQVMVTGDISALFGL